MASFNVMKYSEYPQDGYEEYEKGVLSVKLPSWKDFYVVVQKLQNYRDYFWRGQRCDNWPLVSKFDRVSPDAMPVEREEVLKTHMETFRFAIRGRRGENPPKLDGRECWALGQHYGLNTPLLDWTESPFVAAYFAFIEEEQSVIGNDLMDQMEKELSPATMQRLKDELTAYRKPGKQGCNAAFLRLKAIENELTISGDKVSATFPATVYEQGVLFIRPTIFRRLVRTFRGEKFLAFQVTEEGLRFGDVLMPFDGSDMVLYPNPDTAPERWPPPPPQAEQIPERKQPTLFEID